MNLIHVLPKLIRHFMEKTTIGNHSDFIADSRASNDVYDFNQIRMEQRLASQQTD
jgi:hypothetical protein